MAEVLRYIRENRERYTDDAIRKQLVEAGHPPGLVDDAFRTVRTEAPQQRDPRRWRLFLGYAIGLFAAVFALLVWGSDMVRQTYGIGAAVLLVVMLLGLGLAVLIVRRNRSFAVGLSSGVVTALLVPFLVVVVIAGLCVYATGPTFPAGPAPTPAPEESPE